MLSFILRMSTKSQMILILSTIIGLVLGLEPSRTFILQNELDRNMVKALDAAGHSLSNSLTDASGPSQLSSLMTLELKPLFFHFHGMTVEAFNVHLTSGDVTLEESNVDVLGHRMMLVVYILFVEISGRFKINSHDITHVFDFRLEVNQLRGKGVVSLTSDLVSAAWSFFEVRPESSSIQLKYLNKEDGGDLFSYLNSTQFRNLLIEKLHQDVSQQLTKLISKHINKKLRMSSKMVNLDPYSEEISKIGINNTENANMFVDNLLKVGRVLIQTKFGDNIKIPDIKEDFSEKFLVTFRGSFRATGGVAIGTSSVQRVGNVVFGPDNQTLLHFYGIVGFKALHLAYNHYKAEVWGVGPSGSMTTSFAPLSVLTHLYLNSSSKMVTLMKFKIAEAGDLSVSLTGLGGLFSGLVSRVTTWVVGLYRDKVLQLLEEQYKQYAQDIFATYNIEELLNGDLS